VGAVRRGDMRTVRIHLFLRDSDMLELDSEARNLSAELRLLGLDSTWSAETPTTPPRGAKSGTATEVGTLLVTVANSAVLVAVCQAVGTWLSRGDRGSRSKITMTVGDSKLELTGADEGERERVIDRFFEHLSAERGTQSVTSAKSVSVQSTPRQRRLLSWGQQRD
jgi:hypothetical protein